MKNEKLDLRLRVTYLIRRVAIINDDEEVGHITDMEYNIFYEFKKTLSQQGTADLTSISTTSNLISMKRAVERLNQKLKKIASEK